MKRLPPVAPPSAPTLFEDWARESGYFPFHRTLAEEIDRFRDIFGFELTLRAGAPTGPDGRTAAFWITMPGWLPNRQYALYGTIEGRILVVRTGWAEGIGERTSLKPYRELARLRAFHDVDRQVCADWFRRLVRMHCDKV